MTDTTTDENTITLDTPIRRGETSIDKIILRKPKSGELRGVSLTDLLQMDVNALCTVLPRISSPMVLKQEVGDLDPADLVQIGTRVASFLLTKATMASVSPSA
ncbi:phage tail assembly protein [Variovorax sp. OV700]|uniref:phage tail assembly protein n=1 Tax=Variovorax sp. OV700 TaxID=1882826 RepID=UPI00088A0AA3|nr:phage tail assembly protein [Variovorax sp. OV700]SDI77939.1 Phage tail assembly chaperone protein, E, or 41 or 14 [Variovorax sp. OV700]